MAETIVKRFSADTVQDLRKRAGLVSRAVYEVPTGWSISPIDPGKILEIFGSLRLKTGFALRAYVFKYSGGDGYGVVYALPEGEDLPDPGRRPNLLQRFWGPSKPPTALGRFMEAIEGDGTPFSYLSASIFAREMLEFGAMWHLLFWSTETVLGADPWIESPPGDGFLHFSPSDSWSLNAPRPDPEDWAPRVEFADDSVIVTFITYSGHIEQKIVRITDRFSVGSCLFKTHTTRLATGPKGYIF
jgi:hypothetical protein